MTERTWLRTLGVVAATSTGTLAVLLLTAVRNDQARADAARGQLALARAAVGQLGGEVTEKSTFTIEGGGFGGALLESSTDATRTARVMRTPSAKAAAVWAALGKPLSMPFPNETPLEDVLKYIKQSTQSEAMSSGIPIYVDPTGLSEAEKTLTSPVAIDVEGIPVTTTLRLMLRQLGLAYEVTDDGLLVISNEDGLAAVDPASAVAHELRALRAEVAALRAALRGGKPGSGMTGMMGGMGGTGGGGFR